MHICTASAFSTPMPLERSSETGFGDNLLPLCLLSGMLVDISLLGLGEKGPWVFILPASLLFLILPPQLLLTEQLNLFLLVCSLLLMLLHVGPGFKILFQRLSCKLSKL